MITREDAAVLWGLGGGLTIPPTLFYLLPTRPEDVLMMSLLVGIVAILISVAVSKMRLSP